MAAPVVVILAAGKGTRMRSALPKLAHPMCGRPLIHWPIAAARAAEAAKIVVVDSPGTPLAEHLDDDISVVVQELQLGTGDAARAALVEIAAEDTVVVMNGDVPLIRHETITALTVAHQAGDTEATILTSVLDDPSGWGRVVRNAAGDVTKVVETRSPGDATPEEMLIAEVNSGVYAFSGASLASALERLSNENAQGEYYITDLLGILHEQGHRVGGHQLGDAMETFNVNDRLQLARATREAQDRILAAHMLAGVTILDPASTTIDADVELAADVVIEPGSILRGPTRVAGGATIGPHSTLISAEIGERSRVIHSYVELAVVEADASVGPFSYLRPGTVLHDRAKAGAFVEIKNSQVGEGSKVPHLSYIGDADIGVGTNIGASTITANYDGVAKHRTTIGDHVHSSVHVSFVAPVSVGDHAWTGAGSVITEDVPAGALGIARERQTNKPGYDEQRASARKPA